MALLLGRTTEAGVTVESYWDIATATYFTKRIDHAAPMALRTNQEGQKDTRRRKKPEDGEYGIFRMSHDQRAALVKLYPDLAHRDGVIRTEAWNRLRYNPIARKFQLTRPPGRDKVSFSSPSPRIAL